MTNINFLSATWIGFMLLMVGLLTVFQLNGGGSNVFNIIVSAMLIFDIGMLLSYVKQEIKVLTVVTLLFAVLALAIVWII